MTMCARLGRLIGVGVLVGMGCDPSSEPEPDPEPDSEYCEPVEDWPQTALDEEDEVLALVNRARAEGATCGDETFPPAAPLTMSETLACAARAHSLDMETRGFFGHDNPDGDSPFDRMEMAGYRYRAAGENIAAGYRDTDAVVSGWLGSPGHCANIMGAAFTELGVGHVGQSWTQVFGAPG